MLLAGTDGFFSPVDEFEHFAGEEVLCEAFPGVFGVGCYGSFDGAERHEGEEGKVAGDVGVRRAEEELQCLRE